MKTFDEYAKENGAAFPGGGLVVIAMTRPQYEKTQLDAIKFGMTEALNIVWSKVETVKPQDSSGWRPSKTASEFAEDCKSAIETARETKTL